MLILLACSTPDATPDESAPLPACVTDVELYAGCHVSVTSTETETGDLRYTDDITWGSSGIEVQTRTLSSGTSEWRYTWAGVGLVSELRHLDDGVVDYVWTYDYDDAGLLARLEMDDDASGSADRVSTYAWYDDGWLEREDEDVDADGVVDMSTSWTWAETADGRVGESVVGSIWQEHDYDVRDQLVREIGASTYDHTDIDWTRTWERDTVCLPTRFSTQPGWEEVHTRDDDGRLVSVDTAFDDSEDRDDRHDDYITECP